MPLVHEKMQPQFSIEYLIENSLTWVMSYMKSFTLHTLNIFGLVYFGFMAYQPL